jgi:uncharacterized SAM-binding protein YcdF (DUF218 family)
MRKLKQLISMLAGGYIFAAGIIVMVGLNDRIANADLIIVPGNTIAPDGTPSPRLKARLDTALQLFYAHHAPLIFLSGGTGKEGFDEAAFMASYLMKNGVPPTVIIKDGLGIDTAATAKNAASFMSANNLKSAFIATQYFHHVAGTAHAPYFEMRDLYSIPRETIAYVAYFINSRFQQVPKWRANVSQLKHR